MRIGLLLFGILLLFGCLKEGPQINGLEGIQLVVVPSTMEVELGDTVNFDILLLGEIVDADLYIDNSKIPGHEYIFRASGIYTVHAQKEGVKNSDTIEINIASVSGRKLFIKASETEIMVGEEVSFTAGYINVEPIMVNADFYVDGVKISGNNYKFDEEGTYTVIAKKETFEDSDPIIIKIKKTSLTVTVYVAGNTTSPTSRKRFGHYWKYNGGGVLSYGLAKGLASDANKANDIVVDNGDIYIAGAVLDYSREIFSAQYWKRDRTALTVTTLLKGRAEANAITIDAGDIYAAGRVEGHPVYWKNGTLVDLAESGSNDWFTTTDIATYNGTVYITGGTDDDDAPSNSKAFYWKNNASGKVPLYGDGTGALASGVDIHNGNVYISGANFPVNADRQAVYWKNGNMVKLTTGNHDSGTAHDIAITANGDVYVAGFYSDANNYYAVYWKNGDLVKLTNGTEMAEGFSIAIAPNGDVYVAGWETHDGGYGSVAKYWKVDESQNVEEVKLSKESDEAKAKSIYLVVD